MKVVFLHGIGDGDLKDGWLEGLNRGLTQAGYPPIDRDEVIAPRYAGILKTEGIAAKLPPVTYKPKDEATARREFERRQARVQRLLRLKYGVRPFGFNRIPDAAREAASKFFIDNLSQFDLHQVRRYISEESVRGAVMEHIIDRVPKHGDVLLIAHSLGSVIAIDLLDHLPEDLHIRRFITIGSPANLRVLHENSERLLKKFPYARVDDWSNLFNARDIVPGGRGLAATFPGAQDFMLKSISGHRASTYLGDAAIAGLVADVLYPTAEVKVATSDIVIRMSEAEASALLVQHFADAVARNIKDGDRAERYRAALKVLRDDLVAQFRQQAAAGQLLAPEINELIAGALTPLPQRWELHRGIGELIVLAMTNCVAPYEIDPGASQMKALEEIAVEMGFRRQTGATVAAAIKDVQACITAKSGVPWGRTLTAAAGLALIAAGPVGLAVAAPAGAFGAAAITGGLAAFGPGGMVGGLAMLGGLAGTGAAATAAAVATGSETGSMEPDLTKLILRVATEHARKQLDLPYDSTLWYQLTDFESQISAMLNRLAPFNDPKSGVISKLESAKVAVGALMRFLIEHGLGPTEITNGDQE